MTCGSSRSTRILKGFGEAQRCDPYNPCRPRLGHEAGPWVVKVREVVTWLLQVECGLCLCQVEAALGRYEMRWLADSAGYARHLR